MRLVPPDSARDTARSSTKRFRPFSQAADASSFLVPPQCRMANKTLLLVDGSSYLYRAYHALPDLRSPDGFPTGALHGMVAMMKRLREQFPAEHAACVFDAKGEPRRSPPMVAAPAARVACCASWQRSQWWDARDVDAGFVGG